VLAASMVACACERRRAACDGEEGGGGRERVNPILSFK